MSESTAPIKFTIALSVDGQEALVKGLALYSWYFHVARLPADGTTNAQGEAPMPEGYLAFGEVELHLPSKEACVPAALAYLQKREQALMKEFQEDLHKLAVRKADLLALPAPAPSTPADLPDLPF